MSIKTTKRLALGVIAALVFAPFAAVVPASGAAVTGSAVITPIRATFTGVTQHVVAPAAVTITATGAEVNAVAAAAAGTRLLNTVALTSAPSVSATLTIAQANVLDATPASLAVTASNAGAVTLAASQTLTAASTAVAITTAAAIGGITFAVNQAGTYSGTITTEQDGAGNTLVTPFTFTTVGVPASYKVTASATTMNRQGVTTFTVEVLDATAKRTQIATLDAMNLTSTGNAGTISSGAALDATELGDGIETFTFTETANVDGASTVTVTPVGTLPSQGLAAKATVITVTGAINGVAVTAIAVSAPAIAVAAGTPVSAATAAVPTGTSAITVGVTGAVSSVLRFQLVASAGTLNGLTIPLTQFVNVTTDTAGKGSMSATLGGAAIVTGATLSITQVTGTNAGVAGVSLIITQTDPTVSATSITQSPGTAETAKLGAIVNVTVTVKDQFGTALPAFTVRAFRGATTAGTLVGTKTTAADGTAVFALTNLATLVVGSAETYSFSAQAVTGAAIADNAALVITYTATGLISDISVASALGGTTTPLLASQSTPVAVMPSVLVPTDGTADAAASGTFIVATGLTGVAIGGERVQYTPSTTASATNVTVTASAGAFVSKTASTAWNKGSASVQVPSGTAIYAFATKVGTHTITFTAGGKSVKAQFKASNAATDYYNIAISGPTSVVTGSNNNSVVTVTDVFGNPVNAAAGIVAVSTSAPTAILLGGFNSAASVDVGAAGTANVLLQAASTPGSSVITAAPGGTPAAAWATGYVPPIGAPAPVKSATLTVAVTAAPAAPVEVVYEKPTLTFTKSGGRIILSGTAVDGEGDIIIYTKKIGTTAWKERAKTLEVAAPGDFNGSIKALKNNVVIRVKQEGTGLFSNQVIVLK